MLLRARSIAQASTVKIELSIGRDFLIIVLFRTAAHAVSLLSLKPSIKTHWLGFMAYQPLLVNFYANSSISNNSVQHEYSLIVKNISISSLQFIQTVLIQPVQFSITDFVYAQLNVKTVLY